MLAEVPMIRRVAERKAERIGRRLRLDMIDAQKRESVAFLLQAVEGRADNVPRADPLKDEALPGGWDWFLPVTHVRLEDVAKLRPASSCTNRLCVSSKARMTSGIDNRLKRA